MSDWGKAFISVVILIFASSALAGPAEDLAIGYDAYSRGDHTEAANWFQKSARHGNATAQDSLGVMHANGEGVQHDYVLAYMWFEIALENVPLTDAHWRSRLAQFKAASAAYLTPAQITEAQHLARNWKSEFQLKSTSP